MAYHKVVKIVIFLHIR